MEFGVWLALIGLFLAGGLTPGPAVMLVVNSALRYGFRPALLPALGVSTANLVWIALAASGAAALAETFPGGFLILKFLGVAFIIWIAVQMVRNPPQGLAARATDAPKRSTLYAKGIGLQLANPNALVFFGALLPSYFDPARPVLDQAAIMVITVTATEMFGLAVYAALADGLAKKFQSPVFARRFAIVAAIVMAGSAGYAAIVTS